MSRFPWKSLIVVVLGLVLGWSPHASASVAPEQEDEESTAYVAPWTVAARSLFVPGWGQFYLGRSTAGTVYLTNALIGIVLATELVQIASSENSQSVLRTMGWLQFGFCSLVSSTAAWKDAEARNRENGWMLDVRQGLEGQPGGGLRWRF